MGRRGKGDKGDGGRSDKQSCAYASVCLRAHFLCALCCQLRESDSRLRGARELTSELMSSGNSLKSEWANVKADLAYVEGKQFVLEVRRSV